MPLMLHLMPSITLEEKAKLEAKQEELKKGKAEGRTEGKAEGKREVAMKMLSNGMDITDIAEITSLSVAQIKELHF
ncbi:hypothetical protein FACS189472_06650 [Alphaproteobacteria bacterium]|nr:hypothetical protein FACS189472_06650 [Alphaproteobacteria bacterium]